LISQHYESRGKYDFAFSYLLKHKLTSDTVLSDKNFAHLTFIQTQHEIELKEKENAQLKAIQKSQTKKLTEKN
jgi:hypothetical protein